MQLATNRRPSWCKLQITFDELGRSSGQEGSEMQLESPSPLGSLSVVPYVLSRFHSTAYGQGKQFALYMLGLYPLMTWSSPAGKATSVASEEACKP